MSLEISLTWKRHLEVLKMPLHIRPQRHHNHEPPYLSGCIRTEGTQDIDTAITGHSSEDDAAMVVLLNALVVERDSPVGHSHLAGSRVSMTNTKARALKCKKIKCALDPIPCPGLFCLFIQLYLQCGHKLQSSAKKLCKSCSSKQSPRTFRSWQWLDWSARGEHMRATPIKDTSKGRNSFRSQWAHSLRKPEGCHCLSVLGDPRSIYV